ncbi:MAG: ATP-binding protein [Clostridia bacterium]|nr:ATP-binding protein [Clostridia bacterium]
MTYPTVVLKKAAEQLKKRQEENKQITREKKQKAYIEIPALLEINKKIGALVKLGVASENKVSDVKQALKELVLEREQVLLEKGYPANYLEDYYECPICKDEGFVGSEPCECYKKLIRAEAYKLSNLATRIEKENFSTFSIEIHSEQKYMECILEKAKRYCKKDCNLKNNLLFTGSTGTGKTFLSSCIAKEFLDSGHFVLYQTATRICNIIDDAKFRHDQAENGEYLSMITDCDLLIIDDLGTEYAFGYPQSQLFDILETRMLAGKRTVISTNMDFNELNQKYSPRLVSRILGNYEVFVFRGNDLRYQNP